MRPKKFRQMLSFANLEEHQKIFYIWQNKYFLILQVTFTFQKTQIFNGYEKDVSHLYSNLSKQEKIKLFR